MSHAVCIPYPAQGHITPMLCLAKLLHSSYGFHVTFVNTEYNHNRLLRSCGPDALRGVDRFRFATIPDGLPPSDDNATQDVPSLSASLLKHGLAPFRALLKELNGPSSASPPVTCIISDGAMTFTLDAAAELGVPEVLFWTTSACGFMGYLHYHQLRERGYFPLKDESDLTNGYLDAPVDWVAGMPDIRLRDLPTFFRSTNPDDIMYNYCHHEATRASRASAILINTFDELERPVLEAMSSPSMGLPPVYAVGPVHLHTRPALLSSLRSNLWREDPGCVEWLEGKAAASVVYVNFGSVTVMTSAQLVEFAWGLAATGREFLWIIRPDLVRGESAVVPEEFLEKTKRKGKLSSWCQQDAVLGHPAVGGFLTHCGWNSTIESISAGVPMLTWPFFAEQQTNGCYACKEWGVGMEMDGDVRREKVEIVINRLMGGEKGRDMRKRAGEWKESAVRAVGPGGTSANNFDLMVRDVLMEAAGERKDSAVRAVGPGGTSANNFDLAVKGVLMQAAGERKESAVKAVGPGGTSVNGFDLLVNDVLMEGSRN